MPPLQLARKLLCVLLCTVAMSPGFPAYADDTQHVRHQMGGWSGDIQLYQAGLLNVMLKVTEPEFGPYTLELDTRLVTGNRWVKAMSSGALHTSFRSGASQQSQSIGAVHWYLQPYMKSMLGLRRLLIRREDLPRFAKVDTLQDLQKMSVGQGEAWPDRGIYQGAGIPVVEGKSIEHLVRMLDKRRFDFLALSVLEIEGVIAEYLNLHPDLVVAEDLYIYYPIPVYLTVSKKMPEIATRIEAAMKILFEGSQAQHLDDIFLQYFPVESQVLVTATTRLIPLENPSLSRSIADSINHHFYGSIWRAPKVKHSPPSKTPSGR